MKEYITLKDHEEHKGVKIFVFENGSILGEAAIDVDGSYYFWFPEGPMGCWSAYVLREIADKLDALNKEYDDRMNAYINAEMSNT